MNRKGCIFFNFMFGLGFDCFCYIENKLLKFVKNNLIIKYYLKNFVSDNLN